ncbi:hypothetical protein [Qipengyuania sp. RANM35]|uniref:hypothetical protein n=1 Tax=Qipengyuania sp. RANM35 TaxID=3068635 RepID=UPI0034DAEEB7
MIRKTLIALTLSAALGACGGKDSGETTDANAGARGEVLGGSISDGMIPLDELKSRAAPMKATPASASTGSAVAPAEEAAGEDAPSEAEAPPAEDTAPELPEN